MTFPIVIERNNGKFVATMAGNPKIQAESPTREAAVAAIRSIIADRVACGELAAIEVTPGEHPLFGLLGDDPTLKEMCDEIYKERDAQPKE
jgi:hypothetical protein